MTLFIYICILALNLAVIFMTYKFLGQDMEKKEKVIFIAIGIAIIYVIVSGVYWLSTKSANLGELAEAGKDFIIFTFVPVNAIIALPFFASSYKNMKNGRLKTEKFKNRCILIGTMLVIVLIFEFFYFKDIQAGILSIVQAKK